MYFVLVVFLYTKTQIKIIELGKMNNQNKTTTLSLATYLVTIGYECEIDKQSPVNPQLTFIFKISKTEFEKISDLFWSKKTTVDPLSYFESLRVLKSRIYQYKYQYKERSNERKNSF